jgi:hypothetical protein
MLAIAAGLSLLAVGAAIAPPETAAALMVLTVLGVGVSTWVVKLPGREARRHARARVMIRGDGA